MRILHSFFGGCGLWAVPPKIQKQSDCIHPVIVCTSIFLVFSIVLWLLRLTWKISITPEKSLRDIYVCLIQISGYSTEILQMHVWHHLEFCFEINVYHLMVWRINRHRSSTLPLIVSQESMELWYNKVNTSFKKRKVNQFMVTVLRWVKSRTTGIRHRVNTEKLIEPAKNYELPNLLSLLSSQLH